MGITGSKSFEIAVWRWICCRGKSSPRNEDRPMRAEVYWIEGPWPGRLAIVPRPRGGGWLEDEIQAWRQVGIQTIVSALTSEESQELDLVREAALCEANGIQFISFPIMDRGVPPSIQVAAEVVRRLEERLAAGATVAVHCRQSVGRAAVLAACILTAAGVEVAAAFERIRVARGCGVPDTVEQREWVGRFARDFQAMAPAQH
jgi:protein-tyrosine phosphatase